MPWQPWLALPGHLLQTGPGEPVAGTDRPASTKPPENACVSVGEWSTIPADQGELTVATFGATSHSIYALAADGGLWHYRYGAEFTREKIGKERYQAFRPSPDGKYIAGIADNQLWLLDVSNGGERSLNTAAYGVLAWRSDGTALYFAGAKNNAYGIAEVHLETGAVRWWITSQPGTRLPDPAQGLVQEVDALFDRPHPEGSLLADDRQLLFSLGHSGVGTVYRLDLLTAQAYAYPRTSGDGFGVRWHPDGVHAFFGWGPIYMLNVSTGEIQQVDLPAAAIAVQDVSADGALLLLSRQDNKMCWMVGPAPAP